MALWLRKPSVAEALDGNPGLENLQKKLYRAGRTKSCRLRLFANRTVSIREAASGKIELV